MIAPLVVVTGWEVTVGRAFPAWSVRKLDVSPVTAAVYEIVTPAGAYVTRRLQEAEPFY